MEQPGNALLFWPKKCHLAASIVADEMLNSEKPGAGDVYERLERCGLR